ncbi:MAG: helix-turn-helix transcriptional regulator [Bacteroidota bacterium]|nr:helix-turn-helix transcriptional regulator [Bacteroidota bacterium]
MAKKFPAALKKFGAKIQELRIDAGITQKELSEKCELEVRTIQRIENGEHAVNLNNIIAIALSFDMNPYELLLHIDVSSKGKIIRIKHVIKRT